MDDEAVALLRQHGVQVTAQRLAVLRAVQARPHSTVEAVAEHVRDQIGSISRQAVYDALGLLSEKRLIRRIQPGASAALYDPRVGPHHHAVCRVCGRTVDVDDTLDSAVRQAAAASSEFKVDAVEVIFWGACPDCVTQPDPDADPPPTRP